MNRLVIIKGGGDLATGIAHRLFRCGFDIVITEIEQPTVIRRSVAFANAIFDATGVRLREVPFTPSRVLAALKNAPASK